MKKILLILLLITFLNSADAQWFLLNSGTTNQLNDVCVVSPEIVYVAGNGGLILKTMDGGLSWSQKIPLPYNLLGISFTDQNTGMAVGDNGIILKTTDGGNVWFPLNSGITNKLRHVWYSNLNDATILQDGNNKYLKTSNGGTSWQIYTAYPSNYTFYIASLAYTNWGPRRGVFTGAGFRNDPPGPIIRVIFISENGSNWNSTEETTFNNFGQVSILPNGRVFALDSDPGKVLTRMTVSGSWETRGTLGNCNDLFFVNDNSGTALKTSGIFHTSDGGWNWELVSFLTFYSLAFADSNTGYAVGIGGSIAKTINGGVVRSLFSYDLDDKSQFFREKTQTEGANVQKWNNWKQFNVIQSTYIQNKKFVRFSHNSESLIDSSALYHFDKYQQKLFIINPPDTSIRLAVDFTVAPGDSFYSFLELPPRFYKSEGYTYSNIFGQSFLSFKITSQITPTSLERYTDTCIFADKLGLIERKYTYENLDWPQGPLKVEWLHKLRSAVLDTIYEHISLDITSLSPLEDRKVNEFPFTLSAVYYTNLNEGELSADSLVDKFFVLVKHIRGLDTISTLNINFDPDNNAYININPAVGDKLLIKAYISDSTIFMNEDTYPDSGYAEILVLPSTVDVNENEQVYSFNLDQNYPNPFNPSTNIQYSIPERSFVSLIIYDAMGNEIARPVNEEKNAGIYNYQFDGSALASGVYFYKLNTAGNTQIKKMILIK